MGGAAEKSCIGVSSPPLRDLRKREPPSLARLGKSLILWESTTTLKGQDEIVC